MNNKKQKKIGQIMRRGIQILAFALFPGMFTTVFYAVRSVYHAVITQNFSIQTQAQSLLIVGSVFGITLLFGRFFCGFLCSFGAMGDLIWFISKKTNPTKWKISKTTDAFLKKMKYLVLLTIVIIFWTIQFTLADANMNPWNVFGMYTSIKGWSSPKALISIGGLLLLLIMIGSYFVERFFCRYLCPLGALFSLVGRFRIYRFHKTRDLCGSCRACTNRCAMGIPLYEQDEVKSGECIQCFQCMGACPRENIKAKPNPIIMSLILAAALTAMINIGSIVDFDESVSNQQIKDSLIPEGQGTFQDGVYSGTGMGFRGETKVTVTVTDGRITDITIDSYADDDHYFDRAKDSIIQEILGEQSVEVDTVSGATYSSNGIKEAVANALEISYTTPNDSKEEHSEHSGFGKGKHWKNKKN